MLTPYKFMENKGFRSAKSGSNPALSARTEESIAEAVDSFLLFIHTSSAAW